MGQETKKTGIVYEFSGKLWKSRGQGGWHFVSLTKQLSNEIRKKHGKSEEGWGRLKASVKLGGLSWETSIWYDTKSAAYQVPIKAVIRNEVGLKVGKSCTIQLCLEDERGMFWG